MKSNKKIVVIGGGNGTATILASLKSDPLYELSAIVGMADNGGTNGMLRSEYGSSAVSDIRNCLAGLCDDEKLRKLFSYRFAQGSLKGHGFGSLYIAAAELTCGDIFQAIDLTKKALDIKADIIPITLSKPTLKLEQNGEEYLGVYEITKMRIEPEPKISLMPISNITKEASQAIINADLIIVAPGNFYCSIAQVFVVDGIKQALNEASAQVVQFTNLVNLDRHCEGFTPIKYAKELERIAGAKFINVIVFNEEEILDGKLRVDESPVKPEAENSSGYELIGKNMLSKEVKKTDPNDPLADIRSSINHDKKAIAEIVKNLLEKKQ